NSETPIAKAVGVLFCPLESEQTKSPADENLRGFFMTRLLAFRCLDLFNRRLALYTFDQLDHM
ncbi:hypothetical protein ACOI7N_09005, partial [Pseudomonas sp. P2758]|uniref:hypothetical protein n=1 Tax=Pseudomonas sp. P2758 TaxID=3409916 RepID=UPI003B5C1A89